MKLSELKIGKRAKVIKINLPVEEKQRLSNVGFTEGVLIAVIRAAPFNDPIEISLRNFRLAIRKKTAAAVTVEEYE